jgi:N-acetylmuramoyl-L-alanine amidase
MAFGPTGSSKNQTVFVDPGHGGADPGAMGMTSSGSQVEEKQATLAVGEALESRLTGDGYRVVLSRTQDTLVADGLSDSTLSVADEIRDLQARVDCANAAGAAALVSIHFNSFGDSSTGGSETFYDDVRPFAAQNQVLARDVQSALVRSLGLQNRGVTSDDQLNVPTTSGDGAAYGHLFLLGPPQAGLVTRASSMPGTLTEPLFVSEPTEADLVTSGSGQQQVADSIAGGVESFLQKS